MLLRSDKEELSRMIHQVMEDHGGVKAIAYDMNKNYHTVMNQVNPHNQAHKLGLYTTIDIMDMTTAKTVLEWLTQRYGYTLIPMIKTQPATHDIFKNFVRLSTECGEISKDFFTWVDSGPFDKGNKHELNSKISNLVQAAHHFAACIQAA